MKKIGILTFSRSNNYGTLLQAYASQQLLQKYFKNHNVEIVDFDYLNRTLLKRIYILKPGKNKYYFARIITYIKIRKFLEKNLKRSKRIIARNANDSDKKIEKMKYDILVSGSDEIWANKKDLIFPNSYFIASNNESKKYSMATSANRGNFEQLNNDIIDIIKNRLEKYEYITVRDKNTKENIEKLGINVDGILKDPTIVYDFPKCTYSNRIQRKIKAKRQKKVLIMLSNKKIAKNMVNFFKSKEYGVYTIYNHYRNTIALTPNPIEFTNIFSEFDFVITDFFHGTIFSIKNKANFVSIDSENNYDNVESKIEYLLKDLGLLNRYYKFNNIDDKVEQNQLENKIVEFLENKNEYDISDKIKKTKKEYKSFFKKMEESLNEKNI